MKKIRRTVYQCTVFFELNELGGYTVTVPSLPGLVTEGKNLEQAREMAEDAIRCYIEGLRKRAVHLLSSGHPLPHGRGSACCVMVTVRW